MSWPRWYPGLELCSRHLVSLEDYLLERSRYIDSAYGVSDFASHHLSVDETATGASLKLLAVKGLTRDGQPVKVDTPHSLSCALPPEFGVLDIWVEVNPESRDNETSEKAGKYALLCEPSSATAPRVTLEAFRDRLYLGRYSLEKYQLTVIHRPIPLYLAGLKPLDDSWQEWTKVLPEIIQTTAAEVRQFAKRHSGTELMASAIFGELLLLGTDWPVKTFTQLAHRLQRVRLLTTTLFQGQDFPMEPMVEGLDIPHTLANGDDLPLQLASILEPCVQQPIADVRKACPEVGTTITTEQSGKECLLFESLGEDDDGFRYRARVNTDQILVRWYRFDAATEERRGILQTLIAKGPPSRHYGWPLELAHSQQSDGFGYIRRFAGEPWRPFKNFSSSALSPAMVTAAINLVQTVQELHDAGLCFVGLTLDDVLVDDAAQVLVLFNDNISINNVSLSFRPRGRDFLAFELVTGMANADGKTDWWTMGVLLFWLFIATHPLQPGAMARGDFDPFAEKSDPVDDAHFLFGPEHDAAIIEPSALDRWKRLPVFMRDAFLQVFISGARSPGSRLKESDWLERLLRVRDRIFYCENAGCRQMAFYDRASRAAHDYSSRCVLCGEELVLPPRLRIGRDTVVILCPDAKLYAHHVDKERVRDFNTVVATVERNDKSGGWGLVNRSETQWSIQYRNDRRHILRPGHGWPLDADHLEANVDFGRCKGNIRAGEPLAEVLATSSGSSL